jgi:hypothetical protein
MEPELMRKRTYTFDETGWASVIAIDPGGTTGWELLCIYPDALVKDDVSILASVAHRAHGLIGGREGEWEEDKQVDEIVELIDSWPDAAIVIESFTLRKFSAGKELLSPVRITAKIERELWAGDAVDFAGERIGAPPRAYFTQPSSLAFTTCTDLRLKEWNMYTPGPDHVRAATKHALTFLRRAKERKLLRNRAWPGIYGRDGDLL